MLESDRLKCLPSSEELPDSDDTPVDNELQNLVPNLLQIILALFWQSRNDWFFGIDMGIYHTPGEPPLVPDGFLSLGVERFVGEEGRLSYVLWEENRVVPIWALEVVSKTYGGEYESKKADYAHLGILYYTIYAPTRRHRRKGQPLEVYRLENGSYQRQLGEPVWMPEIGLGIGRAEGTYGGWTREWLYWFDENGRKLPSPEEFAQQESLRAQQESLRAQQESLRAQQESLRAQRLAAKLRSLGIDPDSI